MARKLYASENPVWAHLTGFSLTLLFCALAIWSTGFLAGERKISAVELEPIITNLPRQPALRASGEFYPLLAAPQSAEPETTPAAAASEIDDDLFGTAAQSVAQAIRVKSREFRDNPTIRFQPIPYPVGPPAPGTEITEEDRLAGLELMIVNEAICPLEGWDPQTLDLMRELVLRGFTGQCSEAQVFAARSPMIYNAGVTGWILIGLALFGIAGSLWLWWRMFRIRSAYRWLYDSQVMLNAVR